MSLKKSSFKNLDLPKMIGQKLKIVVGEKWWFSSHGIRIRKKIHPHKIQDPTNQAQKTGVDLENQP